MRWGIPTSWLGTSLLCVLVFFIFRLPLKTPFEQPFFVWEAAFFVVLLIGYAAYAFARVAKRRAWPKEEMVLLSVLTVPLLGASMSWLHFRQPLLFGLIAQREYTAILGVLFVLALIRWQVVGWDQIRRATLIMAGLTVLHWLILYLFVDYSVYATWGGRVSTSLVRGDRLRWERLLTALGGLYYVILFARTKRPTHLAAAAIFLFYIYIVTLSRAYAVAFTGALALFVFERARHVRGRWVKYLVYGLVMAMIFVYMPILLFPQLLDSFKDFYGAAFRVVLTGERTYEGAADARIRIAAIAWPYIQARPLLGNGAFSRIWIAEHGFPLGPTFAPVDIGILGGIFVYGLIGVTIALFPYLYRMRRWWPFSQEDQPPFLLACRYFVVYFLLRTLTTGFAFEFPVPGLFALALLHMAHVQQRSATRRT